MADASAVELALWSLKNELRRRIHQQLDDEAIPLSAPQAQLLVIIAQEPGISAQGLAQRTGRDKATITRMLGALLERGWVERSPDQTDARRRLLRLGEQGHDIAHRCVEARQRAHEAMFGALSEAEKAQLVGLLEKCTGR